MAPASSPGLAPSDAVVALRSFPRRYREVFASIEGDDTIEALAARIGPGGRSAAGVVSDVTRTWALLGEALRQILFTEGAVATPGGGRRRAALVGGGPPRRRSRTPSPCSGHEADALVDLVRRVADASDWGRSAPVAGGTPVTALDVLRDAVQTGADGLGQAETILRAVRGEA